MTPDDEDVRSARREWARTLARKDQGALARRDVWQYLSHDDLEELGIRPGWTADGSAPPRATLGLDPRRGLPG